MKLTRPLPVTADVTSTDSFRSEGNVNVASSAPAAGALYHVIVISFQLVLGTRRSTTLVPALPTKRNDSVAFSTSVTPWTSNIRYPRRSGLPRLSTVQDVPKFPPGMSTLTCVSHCEPSPKACIPGPPPDGVPSAPAAWDAPRTSVADSTARTRVAWRSRPDGRCLDDGDRIGCASGEGGTVGIGSTPGHSDPLDGVLQSGYGRATRLRYFTISSLSNEIAAPVASTLLVPLCRSSRVCRPGRRTPVSNQICCARCTAEYVSTVATRARSTRTSTLPAAGPVSP